MHVMQPEIQPATIFFIKIDLSDIYLLYYILIFSTYNQYNTEKVTSLYMHITYAENILFLLLNKFI